MAPDEEKTKRWTRDYDACVECGGTDQPHSSKGLCKRCDSRRRYREKRGAAGAAKRRKLRSDSGVKPTVLPGTAVTLPANVYTTVGRLAAAFGCTPDEAVAIICRNYLAEIGVDVDAAGGR